MRNAYEIPIFKTWSDSPPIHLTAFKKALRNAWRDHFGKECQGCGCFMHFEIRFRSHRHYATIDHIKARACGGDDSLKNLQVICLDCNARKSEGEHIEAELIKEGYAKAERKKINEDCPQDEA